MRQTEIMRDITKLNKMCLQVRRDIIRQVHGCQSGHPGGSLGCTEYFVALYFDILDRKSEFNMDGTGEDIFS